MHEILLASNNYGKFLEFKYLIEPLNIKAWYLSDKKFHGYIAPLENGTTFQENSIIKCKSAAEKYSMPVVADDSGLCVKSLNNRPGIYSARYGGNISYVAKMQRLSREIGDKSRFAWFYCHLTYIYPNKNTIYHFTGSTRGWILRKPLGGKGFGYDPIFYSPTLRRSFGQITVKEKSRISHRSVAFNKFIKFLIINQQKP